MVCIAALNIIPSAALTDSNNKHVMVSTAPAHTATDDGRWGRHADLCSHCFMRWLVCKPGFVGIGLPIHNKHNKISALHGGIGQGVNKLPDTQRTRLCLRCCAAAWNWSQHNLCTGDLLRCMLKHMPRVLLLKDIRLPKAVSGLCSLCSRNFSSLVVVPRLEEVQGDGSVLGHEALAGQLT